MSVGGDTLNLAANFTTLGAYKISLRATAATTDTLPVSGTITVKGASSVFGQTTIDTTTSTAAYKMGGLGGTWAITPKAYGVVQLTIDGQVYNSTSGDSVLLRVHYGTGSAPSKRCGGGVSCGLVDIISIRHRLVVAGVPFSRTVIVSGLSPGTAYWFDVAMQAGTGGTAYVRNVEYSARELSN